MNCLRMDLKVCEGCGALWLRVYGTDGVYCRGCVKKLAEFPAGTRFEASTTVAERGRHAAEFDELEAAAAADGLSLHVQTPR